MSKNKNPLKDLDQFLKQQASSFVNPTPLSEKVEPVAEIKPEQGTSPSPDELIERLQVLAKQDIHQLYNVIIKVAEQQSQAEQAMLINTALYLKGGDNWKEVIRDYWSKKVSA